MDPIAALRRTAFLLERAHADTYRVQAFRKAVPVVAGLGANELRRRVAEGTLTELKGIGKATASLVAEAAGGHVPSYLAKLEAEAGPLASGGEQLREALRGDLHCHSDWSDGGSPIEDMAVTALELGHEYLALTDHSARLRVANGLSAERRVRQLDVIAGLDERLRPAGLRLLPGIEVDILEDGALDCPPELLARLDVVVASVHSKLRMERAAMTRRMVAAVHDEHIDVLGHCTGRLIGVGSRGRDAGERNGRPPSSFDADAVFAACADQQVAVEVNSRPERLDPPLELLRKAVDAGCLFSVDTDAHAPGQLDWQQYGCARAAGCEVPPERVVNTWDADRLLAWSHRRG